MDNLYGKYTKLFKSGVSYNEQDFAKFITAAYGDLRIKQRVISASTNLINFKHITVISNGAWIYAENIILDVSTLDKSEGVRVILSISGDENSEFTIRALEYTEEIPDNFILIGWLEELENDIWKYTTLDEQTNQDELEEYMRPDYMPNVNVGETMSFTLPTPIHNYKTLKLYLGGVDGSLNNSIVEIPIPNHVNIGQTLRNNLNGGTGIDSGGHEPWVIYLTTMVVLVVESATTLKLELCGPIRHNTSFKIPFTYPHLANIPYHIVSVEAYKY